RKEPSRTCWAQNGATPPRVIPGLVPGIQTDSPRVEMLGPGNKCRDDSGRGGEGNHPKIFQSTDQAAARLAAKRSCANWAKASASRGEAKSRRGKISTWRTDTLRHTCSANSNTRTNDSQGKKVIARPVSTRIPLLFARIFLVRR